jgi:dUTP pyrophosphatase
VRLRVQRLRDDVVLPTRAHPGDAGLDLRTADEVVLAPGGRVAAPTGLVVAVPEGHVGLVHPRSGLALRDGVTVVNAPGTIDAGYRGEVRVALVNLSDRPVRLAAGERVAQLVVQRVTLPEVAEVTDLADEATSRGGGGFGSTGRR